eukprot:GHVS01091299.1.p1 GENE.GHVS01091299.1~~GHVS01091299.1.p1  ORF type:complete len:864 (+),score=161.76 GHVS01091299.1:85-2592(+)
MEPKTDAGCFPHLAITIPRALREGLLRPLNNPIDICVLLDGLLCNLYLWLCGHCPAQTIFSCLYLHYPPAIASTLTSSSSALSSSSSSTSDYTTESPSPLLASSLSLFLLLCSHLRHFTQKAGLPYREEDFPTHLPQELVALLPHIEPPTEESKQMTDKLKTNKQEEEEGGEKERTKKLRWEEVLADRLIQEYIGRRGAERRERSDGREHAETGEMEDSMATGWDGVVDRLRFLLELSRFVGSCIDIAEPLPTCGTQLSFEKNKNTLFSYLPPLLSVEQTVGTLRQLLTSIRATSTGTFTRSSSGDNMDSSSGDSSSGDSMDSSSRDITAPPLHVSAVMRSFDNSISRHRVSWQPPRIVPAANIDEALSFFEQTIEELLFVCREARSFLSSCRHLLEYFQQLKQVNTAGAGSLLGDGVGNCKSMGILPRSFSYCLMVRVEEVAKASTDYFNQSPVAPFERSRCFDQLVLEMLEKNGMPAEVSAGYWNRVRRELEEEAGGKKGKRKKRNKKEQHSRQDDEALKEGQNINEEMATVMVEMVKKHLDVLVSLMQVGHLTLARQHRRLEHSWVSMDESCCYGRRADVFANTVFQTALPYPAPMQLMATELVIHTLLDKLALGFRLDLYDLHELPHIYWSMERLLLWVADAELAKQRLLERDNLKDRKKRQTGSSGLMLWWQAQADMSAVLFRVFLFLKRSDAPKRLEPDERWRCMYKHHVRFSRAESEVSVLPDISPSSFDVASKDAAHEVEVVGLSSCLQRLEHVRANCEDLLANTKLQLNSVLRKKDIELLIRLGKKQQVTIRLLNAQRDKFTASEVSTATHPVFLCPVVRYKTTTS